MKTSARDPFGERLHSPRTRRHRVLGADIDFASDSRELLDLVDQAFAGGPRHRLAAAAPLRMELRLIDDARRCAPPALPRLRGGAGLLYGAFDADNFAMISTMAGRGLVVVTRAMLAHAHAVRYELIEFAALTLASRSQGLVPLHAACIGRNGRGLLLLGDSGAGKSTLSLFAVLEGLRLIGEDNVFVMPDSLAATGLSNYLHVRRDLGQLLDRDARRVLQGSDIIRRRSGAQKLAVDLRGWRGALAPRPQRIVGVVCLSARPARRGALLAPLSAARVSRALRRTQPYATSHPRWRTFERRLSALPAWRLDRGANVGESLGALRHILELA